MFVIRNLSFRPADTRDGLGPKRETAYYSRHNHQLRDPVVSLLLENLNAMLDSTRRGTRSALSLIFTLAALTDSAPTWAQEPAPATPPPVTVTAPATGSVLLKIYAKGNGRPVGRAEVKIGETKLFADKNGEVTVNVPASGDGAVEIYRSSYQTLRIEFATLRGKPSYEAYLRPATPPDNEVTIRGAKRPETSRKTVSVEEAAKVAPGGDPAQVPKLLPGVQSSSFSPDIVVRGSGPNDSQYFIDDFTVPFIFHSIGNISIIPDQLLSDVEFSSGGFGAQYGGATGGVINLRTKTSVPDHATTEFRTNLPVYSSIYHERPIEDGKAMVAVSLRRSYLETFLKLVLPKDGDLTVSPYFGDAHVYYVQPRDDGHLKVLALHAYDGLHLLFPGDAATDENGMGRFDTRTTASVLGVEWRKVLNSDWSFTASPHIVDTRTKIDVVGNEIAFGGTGPVLQGEAVRRLGGKDRLYLGSQFSYLHVHADVYAAKPDPNDPFADFQEAPKVRTRINDNVYSSAHWVALDKELGSFMMTPGLRLFYDDRLEESGADPRLNVRYQLNEQHALKAATGQYSQAPQFQETDKAFGNPDLTWIRSYHYVLGLETKWSDRWNTDFQTFYKETKNVVSGDPETNTNNDGSLISYGFEAFIRRNMTSRLFGWLSYTYSNTRERDSDQETYKTAQYDQTHVANFVANYKMTAQWDLGSRIVYHTGDTYTRVDDAVYNANLDKYQRRQSLDAEKSNARLPPYHEIDVFSSTDLLFDAWKMTLRFGIEYLALKPQAVGVTDNYDYSESEYFRGIPPIPYIEVRGVL